MTHFSSRLAGMAQRLRNSQALQRQTWLWNLVRGPYRTAVRSFAGSKGLRVRVNGEEEFYIARVYSRELNYEPEVWNRIRTFISPGMRIFDIGAFQGVYTLMFALRAGEKGQVIALEPNPLARAGLMGNLESNALSARCKVLPKICGETPGRMTLRYVPTDDFFRAGFSSVVPDIAELEQTQPKEVECEVATLDQLADEFGAPGLIKVDVEGFELRVLRGAERALRAHHPLVFCEVHPEKMKNIHDDANVLVSWMKDLGYIAEFMDGKSVEGIPAEGTWNVVFRPRVQ